MKKPASLKYELTIPPGLYHVKGFGEVDLRNLTLEKAEYLVKKGFPHLKEKPKSYKAPDSPRVKKIGGKKSKISHS